MKRMMSFVLAVLMTLSLAACGRSDQGSSLPDTAGETAGDSSEALTEGGSGATSGNASDEGAADPSGDAAPEASGDEAASEGADGTAGGNVLVAYFSWSGNTQEMASYIAERTGGDLLEIQPQTPYPTDYNECGEVAQAERDNNERPAIANLPDSIDQYDTILIGYPIWWHTAPMIIGTFLENYDLTGKEVYPFTQSASMDTEQFANSVAFVEENAPGASVHDGLFTRPSNTEEIDAYLADNGLAR